MLLIVFFVFALASSEIFGARILGIFPTPSISHQFFFQPMWRELSLRGHEVVVVATNPLNDSSLVNLTEIDISYFYEMTKKIPFDRVFSKDNGIFSVLHTSSKFMDKIQIRCFEDVPKLKEIIEDKNEHFDLIIVEGFLPMLYGLSYRFKAPIISAISLEPSLAINDLYGTPSHPILYPCPLFMLDGDWTITKKIQSVVFSVYQRFYSKFFGFPESDRLARKYFGNEMPYIESLMKNTSLVFINRNLVFNTPRALVPNFIELPQMHIKPVKPLPSDLKAIMDNATEGIIYFSLGSNILSSNLPPRLRKTIMDTLSELPFKVLWKFETNDLTDLPHNVIIRKWFPQQDVLAHSNVKAFVTQGGIQSLEEAISRCVPIIGLPFMADQHSNIHRAVQKGLGLRAEPTVVTKQELKRLIIQVAENTKYRQNVKEMQQLLLDQPMNSTEKIIWWTEYVLRHKGASHLKSAAVDSSFIEYYLLDVFATIVAVPVLIFYLPYYFLKPK